MVLEIVRLWAIGGKDVWELVKQISVWRKVANPRDVTGVWAWRRRRMPAACIDIKQRISKTGARHPPLQRLASRTLALRAARRLKKVAQDLRSVKI